MDLANYPRLISDLKALQEEARAEAHFAVNRILINTYWKMGERLRREKESSQGESKEFLTRVSSDIGIEYSRLVRILKLATLFPGEPPTERFRRVSWNHYKIVMTIADPKERSYYLERIENERLSVRQLAGALRADTYHRLQTALPVLTDEKKTTHTALVLERKENRLHLYSGMLEKVVDGDTLIFFIDLGFDVWHRQRVRLRGIDAPERKSPEGERAKKFLEETLRGVYRFVIQTFRYDKYGRFVCDVFYLHGEGDKERIAREGVFLNEELVKHGHARLLRGDE